MAPPSNQTLLSPAELSFLHSSLSLTPPIRPDLRLTTQFRPLIAETDILPGTNGSARICFPDGTEAIAGVKAEVEKSIWRISDIEGQKTANIGQELKDEAMGGIEQGAQSIPQEKKGLGETSWVEMTIEIPGFKDDDSLPVFLAEMLSEALLSTGELVDKLYINRRWHWKVYIDILLLSPPLSYPLPLLSLTTHLALLATRLPALKSGFDEDPLFNDDWEAAIFLYPHTVAKTSGPRTYDSRPPVTLLVMSVGSNIIFDPTREELAVADAVLAVSLTSLPIRSVVQSSLDDSNLSRLQLVSIRTIDPPSRLTPAGVPDSGNIATGGIATTISGRPTDAEPKEGVWRPPQGGMKRGLIGKIVDLCLQQGGVGEEVLEGLENVDVG